QRRPVASADLPKPGPSVLRRTGPTFEGPMPQDDAPFVIEATRIVKNFAGVQALRGVDFRVRRGEIHALLGQNGAGKSTLVKILNGVHPAGSYEGAMRVDGKPVQFSTPGEAQAHGVAYVPQ